VGAKETQVDHPNSESARVKGINLCYSGKIAADPDIALARTSYSRIASRSTGTAETGSHRGAIALQS
jgi:hypothetical protein